MIPSRYLAAVAILTYGALSGCSTDTEPMSSGACESPSIRLAEPSNTVFHVGDTITIAGDQYAPCADQGEGLPSEAYTGVELQFQGAASTKLTTVDAKAPNGTWVSVVTVPDVPAGIYTISTSNPVSGNEIAIEVE